MPPKLTHEEEQELEELRARQGAGRMTPFIRGIGSVVNVFRANARVRFISKTISDDAAALGGDWQRVGSDVERSMDWAVSADE